MARETKHNKLGIEDKRHLFNPQKRSTIRGVCNIFTIRRQK